MKRKRLTGWKRMAAFAMALTLTVGDWTSVGAAGLPQTDVQTVTEAVIQEEDAMEAALATEQTEKESETGRQRTARHRKFQKHQRHQKLRKL